MTAAAIVGGIGAIGSSVGANQADKASQRATRAQDRASQRAMDFSKQRFAETKELLNPFIEGSNESFREQQALSGALGQQAESEAINRLTSGQQFQYLQDQGVGDINRQAASNGNLGSGTRLKALNQFRTNLLSQQIGNRFNRLGANTGLGLSAGRALAGFGDQNAQQQANLLTQQGQAQAQGHINRGNAFQSGLEGVAQGIGSVIGGYTGSGG